MTRMTAMTTGLLVAGLVTVGFALFREAGQNMTFYYEVEEISPDEVAGRTVKMSGIVAKDSIERDAKTLTTSFTVASQSGGEGAYPVRYTGPVPDIFRDGVQVVVTGSFNEQGVFEANELMAKCPSKYDTEGDPADFAHLDEAYPYPKAEAEETADGGS